MRTTKEEQTRNLTSIFILSTRKFTKLWHYTTLQMLNLSG